MSMADLCDGMKMQSFRRRCQHEKVTCEGGRKSICRTFIYDILMKIKILVVCTHKGISIYTEKKPENVHEKQ